MLGSTVTTRVSAAAAPFVMPRMEREEPVDMPFARGRGGNGGGMTDGPMGPGPAGASGYMPVDTLYRLAAMIGMGDGSAALENRRREAGIVGRRAERIFHPSVHHHPMPRDDQGMDVSASAEVPPEVLRPFHRHDPYPVGEHPRDIVRPPGVGHGHRTASHLHYSRVRLNRIEEAGTAPHLQEQQRRREREAKELAQANQRFREGRAERRAIDVEERDRQRRLREQRRVAMSKLRRYHPEANIHVD